ncbi:MAG: LysR family transcriptional regulator [Variibacter sp.]|nr:LysR family transcriptional regulator [Variibacter sp.]
MNKLQAIKAFTHVAERRGFTAAAKKLGMSASAVTKSIARLEDELGTQLFNRTTRRIALTDSGQEFYERCVRILADLEDAETAIRESNATPQGRVRIVMPFSFGRVTFVPALPEFYRRYPDIVLDVSFSDRAVDLIQEGYDLAVRTGDLNDSRLIRRVLTKGPMLTVASPAYLAARGRPKTPADLVHHNCILGRFGPEWTFRDSSGGLFNVRVNGNVWLWSGDAVREAAVAGVGIARSTRWLFRKDLEKGLVESVLDEYAVDGVPVSVLYPAKRHMARKLVAVIDFLSEITSHD